MDPHIRDALEDDANAIAAIYAHHVLHGTASYDLQPPSMDFHREKIRRITAAGWPFIVAEVNGRAGGYAYVTQFRDRDAYRFTAEDSVYIDPAMMGQGIGKLLLLALLDRSSDHGFRTVIAVIGGAEPASTGLHRSVGFREVGRLHAVGWKHGQWLDSVYMQRDLAGASRRSE